MRISRHSILLVAALGFTVFPPRTAHAYLDIGTSSVLLQLLIAGFVGVLFALKINWRSIKAFISRCRADKNLKNSEDDDP